MSEPYQTTADRMALRIARRRTGMGLGRLAKEVGVSPSYLSKLELGGLLPSPWVVEAWERAVGAKWPAPTIPAPIPRVPSSDSGQLAFELEGPRSHWVDDLLPIETLLEEGPPAIYEWDLPQTIGELSYLTHNYYRYYGKFPPSIPRKLLRDFPLRDGTWVLDPYSGSGTTLVEAKCEGIPSIGLDISPLATLAGSVKTTIVDRQEVTNALTTVLARMAVAMPLVPEKPGMWFLPNAVDDLGRLKAALLTLPMGDVRSFLVLGFFAIIRRVSRAHDGEVRPHLDESKRERNVQAAYTKKIGDMLDRMDVLRSEVTADTPAIALTTFRSTNSNTTGQAASRK